ncbi:MAG: FadR family transcriptional regulator [Chloroflexi bacterium]|nr:FadR family transcriptional regulator [Chloroflexota bacterium]
MPSYPLKRETLAEQVAQALIDRIYAESLKPGDSLPSTMQLATDFDVSRPVIREALKTLEGQGIIEISNGRSAVVKPITGEALRVFFRRALALEDQTLLELLELRRGIEIQGAILAAERRTVEELAQMKSIVNQMREVIHQPEMYAGLDLKFHLLIASASHNRLMFYLVESIRDALHSTIMGGLRSRFSVDQLERVQSVHEEIVQHIGQGDKQATMAAMAMHFDDAIGAVFSRLASEKGG